MPIKGLKGGIGSKALGYGLGAAAAAAEATDAEFNQTVLLLHGDGSEGAGNTAALGDPNYKAFKDNSTSAHAIAVNGDAYGNDFSPYYYADGYWSVAFDGSSALRIPAASMAFGTGDYTVQALIYVTKLPASDAVIYDARTGSGGLDHYLFVKNVSGSVYLRYRQGFGSAATGTIAISLNEWTHVAITRESGTVKSYVNGTLDSTHTSSTANLTKGNDIEIGYSTNDSNYGFDGYISNFRINIGTAETISVPTSPLTDSSHSFLGLQSSRFIDNSTNNRSITVATGTPKVSTNTPFTVTKTANVGSGFFDGDGDYLETISSQVIPSSNFTIEAFVYVTSTDATQAIVSQGTGSSDGGRTFLGVEDGGSAAKWTAQIGGIQVYSNITPVLHTWHYIAMTYDGSTIRLYLNGTEIDTGSTTSAVSNTTLKVGSLWGAGYNFFGYISDVRISDTVKTISSVPTTSLSSDSNTDLLTCQYSGAVRNVGFLDDSKYNHQITRNGDASMGTFSPFSLEDGYWSNFFNGSSSIEFTDSSDFTVGTSDWIVEVWIYLTTLDNNSYQAIIAQWGNSESYQLLWDTNSSNTRWWLGLSGIANLTWDDTGMTANEWHFLQLVKSGTTYQIWRNGTQVGTDTTQAGTIADSARPLHVGTTENSSNADLYRWNGYLSNLRIRIGTSLTKESSVPTTPLTADSDTKLLTCQSNRFIDNSSSSHSVTVVSTPKVQPFSPIAPSRSYSKDAVSGSAYFDGSGDELATTFYGLTGTGDYTISFWIYMPAYVSTDNNGGDGGFVYVYSQGASHPTYSLSVNITKAGKVVVGDSTNFSGTWMSTFNHAGSYDTAHSLKLGQWNYVHLYRESGTLKIYGNGGLQLSISQSSAIPSPYQDAKLISGQNQCFLSNFRVIDGTAITDTTLPTAPFLDSGSNYDDTVLLTRFDNAGIIDHTMKNNFETENNVRISGQQTKFGTGSIYFDGTTDKLVIPHTNDFLDLGINGEPFTMEVWAYPTNTMAGSGQMISKGGGTASWSTSSGAQYQWTIVSSVVLWNFNVGGSAASLGGGTVTLNTWQHLAVTYDGTTTRTFLNGTQQNTTTNTYTAPTTRNVQYIGMTQSGGYTQAYYGYLDDFRITKGVARYTSSFTAPTEAFANR